jgi:transcription termination factor Rho
MQATVKTARKFNVISFQDFQALITGILNLNNGEFNFIDSDYYAFSNPDYFISYSSTGDWTVKTGNSIGKADYLIDAYEQIS